MVEVVHVGPKSARQLVILAVGASASSSDVRNRRLTTSSSLLWPWSESRALPLSPETGRRTCSSCGQRWRLPGRLHEETRQAPSLYERPTTDGATKKELADLEARRDASGMGSSCVGRPRNAPSRVPWSSKRGSIHPFQAAGSAAERIAILAIARPQFIGSGPS